MKVRLSRNLRKSLLRGHPWIYREAIDKESQNLNSSGLCKILDNKGKKTGWGLYDSQSPLAVRVLSLSEKPPNEEFYQKRFQRALDLRSRCVGPDTNAYRLFNGEGDQLPGLVCDVYADTAVIQFDGQGMAEAWDRQMVVDWLLSQDFLNSVIDKSRTLNKAEVMGGEPGEKVVRENGQVFAVDVISGQKTGFFLDQRDNRDYLRQVVRPNDEVLNLFSYTGGFSVYAGAAGAAQVTSVDIAAGAIAQAEKNWGLNESSGKHLGEAADVFRFLESCSGEGWDVVVCDPPSMASSEKNKPQAVQKYVDCFVAAGRACRRDLFLSSCSSHIGFEDFYQIIETVFSVLRRRGQVIRYSGQGPDHPFPLTCPELRYLKFAHLTFF